MQADFSLEDPATFQSVIPLSHVLPVGRRKRAGAVKEGTQQSSKLLHEKVCAES